jgi:hypothetical protein
MRNEAHDAGLQERLQSGVSPARIKLPVFTGENPEALAIESSPKGTIMSL